MLLVVPLVDHVDQFSSVHYFDALPGGASIFWVVVAARSCTVSSARPVLANEKGRGKKKEKKERKERFQRVSCTGRLCCPPSSALCRRCFRFVTVFFLFVLTFPGPCCANTESSCSEGSFPFHMSPALPGLRCPRIRDCLPEMEVLFVSLRETGSKSFFAQVYCWPFLFLFSRRVPQPQERTPLY